MRLPWPTTLPASSPGAWPPLTTRPGPPPAGGSGVVGSCSVGSPATIRLGNPIVDPSTCNNMKDKIKFFILAEYCDNINVDKIFLQKCCGPKIIVSSSNKPTIAYLCGTYTSVAIDSLAHSQSVFLERFTLKPEKS